MTQEIRKVLHQVGLTVETVVSQKLPSSLKTKFLPEERRVIALKYSSKQVKDLSISELSAHSKALVLKMSVITGWQIPESDEYVLILNDQLRKLLVDEYQNMNIEEIEYAMRSFGGKIQDWGKSMNLALIRSALDGYLNYRAILSDAERDQRREETPLLLPAPYEYLHLINWQMFSKDRQGLKIVRSMTGQVDWSEQWDKIKEAALNRTLHTCIITFSVYDWLMRTGKLSLPAKKRTKLFEDCRRQYAEELKVKILGGKPTREERQTFEKIKRGDWQQDRDMKIRVINMAKVKAVKELALQEAKKQKK